MKLLIIWAAISVVAFIETIAMKASITRRFVNICGRKPKHKATLQDYIISILGCMMPLYHIWLICGYTFSGNEIEARSTVMLLVAEALEDEDNKE